MNSNSSTTQEQSGARKAQAAETAVQPDIAFRVAAILLGGTVVVVVSYSFLAFQTGAWQMFILAGVPVAFGVAILISMGLIRRGRPDLGMGIIIVGILVIFPIASLLVTGIGLVLGLGVVLVNSTIVAQTLPQRYASRAISASVMVGVATLLLDLYGGDYRLAIPVLQTFLPAIIGVLILIYGVFVARQFRDYTLRTKLVTAFVAMVAITMGGMSLITLQTVRSALTEQIGENYTADAENLGRLVAGFLEAKTTEIVALAASDTIKDQLVERNQSYAGSADAILAEIQALDEQWVVASDDDPLIRAIITPDRAANPTASQLMDYLEIFPDQTEIFVTDRHGATLGSTGRLSDYYQADEGWWQAAWNDGKGAIYISDPEYDESAGVTASLIAIPIFDETGKVIGVVRSTLVLDKLFAAIGAAEFGETGRAVLFDSAAEVLYEPIAEGEESSGELPLDLRQHLISMGHFMVATDAEGDQSVFAHSPVILAAAGGAHEIEAAIAAAATNLGWAVVIRQEVEEAFASITQLTQSVQLVGIVTLMLAGLGALFLARSLTQPILVLTAAAEAMRAGDLDARADVESRDETGALATAFNAMADRVSELLTGLEERGQELEARAREIEASQRVTFAASERTSPDMLLNLVVNLIRDQFHLYHAQVYIVDEQRQAAVLRQSTGYAGRRLLQRKHHIPLAQPALVTKAIHTGEPVMVADVSENESFMPNPLLPDTRSELVVPLKVGDEVIGALDVQDRVPGRFTPNIVTLFQTMTDQVAFLFENSDLLERVTERTQALTIFTGQLRTAADIAQQLGAILDPDRLLQQVVELIRSRFGLYHAHVYVLDSPPMGGKEGGGV